MHPRLAELVEYAEAQRAALLAVVALVPSPQRHERVNSTEWSLAEVLEHLHRVESGVARLIARAVERGIAAGVGPERETGSMMRSLDAFGLTDRDRFMSAPETVMPQGKLTADHALAALAESRQALLSGLRAGDGLALGEMTYSHPLLGSLNLYQWVLFIGQHEERHAAQIREIARQIERRPSSGDNA